MTHLTIKEMAQAIETAHWASLALPAATLPPPAFLAAGSAGDDSVYRAAKLACQALGFIEPDAQCVAVAWQNQSRRLGQFDAALWPTEAPDFGLPVWPRADAFAPCPKNLGLYAVLPDADWVARMAQAGVPTLQLRFKSDDRRAIAAQVKAAVQAVQGTQSLLFINDHWQDAIDAGAYGVHLGQEDLDAAGGAHIATLRQSGLRLGLSSHGYAEMLKADSVSPSYIAMGAVYATTLKRMVTPPQGPGRLAAYARLMRAYPLVAIGGIDEGRFDEVLPSGVGSIALVRAIIAASDPERTAARLMLKIGQKITL